MVDVLVIGAGPVGLACAIEAARQRLTARVVDKGTLVNSIVGYPAQMEFFSTPDLIEIGGHPFPVRQYKPSREDALEYYRAVAARERLDIRTYETVLDIAGARGAFRVETTRGVHEARAVVVAIGFFDQPNLLNVSGESLSKVTHYYREPYAYVGQRVAVIGAKNSAAKAALDCHRHGAETTIIMQSAELSTSVKYLIKPDLENRIKEGSIRAFFGASVEEIRADSILVRNAEGLHEVGNDWVLAMTGYHPDYALLEKFGLTFGDDTFRTPVFDENTFETTRPGMYLAGTVCGGYQTNRWFIENGRFHAKQIATHLAQGRVEPIALGEMHWKTQE